MKKLFTVLVGSFLTVGAIAGTAISHPVKVAVTVHAPSGNNGSRALSCDTIFNVDFATADSNAYVYPLDSPNVGYADGNGGLYAGPAGSLQITHVGEGFVTSANSYATAAIAFFGMVRLNANASDSTLPVTAYVYDSTGTSYFGTYGPGNAIDSSTVTTGSIITNQGAGLFTFTHQAVLPGKNFFVMIKLPRVTGDTLVVLTTDGSTGNGRAWLGASGAFLQLDSISQGNPGNWITVATCVQPSGMHDLSGVSELSVYPNPSFGKVNVAFNMESASDVAISVTSITGSKVYETSEKAVSVYNKPLDLSGVAPGIYIVNIKTATGTINRRVSIQ
ncbi:MAG: T9SS type A sorting domain-containing protein [Bacteroidetes bacterium]|nr:T9SS type A sorting domain-containing protein [Bacteroidota bacterium]